MFTFERKMKERRRRGSRVTITNYGEIAYDRVESIDALIPPNKDHWFE